MPFLANLRPSEKRSALRAVLSIRVLVRKTSHMLRLYVSFTGNLNTPVLTRCFLPRYVPLRMKFSASVPEKETTNRACVFRQCFRARTDTSLQGRVSLEGLLHNGRAKFCLNRTLLLTFERNNRRNIKI